MSLVHEQWRFLRQIAELLRKADELGFVVSGGELYRTPEQQTLHVRNGRSTTMNSQHLKRLAIVTLTSSASSQMAACSWCRG